mmetsp:Transcript_23503/g.40183  ORF Transcript_23503/g.40183 Transcript_23503/m.40183 type:complete len:307 (+) Transcript_23503:26-946(+)
MFCGLTTALEIIGAISLVLIVAKFVFWILKHFTKPSDAVLKKLASKGSWAVVTGASDGIGKAYAITLAKKGFNVFLLSRTLSKLEDVAKQVESYGVESKVMSVDFIAADKEVYTNIENEIKSLGNVRVLVNNVGVNYSFPNHFLEESGETDEKLIKVNIGATNTMTRIVLPMMVEQKKGAIVNLSSMAGRIPTPMLAVYSGTKAYIDYFSKCLAQEYKNQGIVVQSVTPGMVVSNMSKIRKTGLMVTSPELIATRSLGRLGCEYELSPFHTHGIINYLLNVAPLSVTMGYLHNMNKATQKRALRKR